MQQPQSHVTMVPEALQEGRLLLRASLIGDWQVARLSARQCLSPVTGALMVHPAVTVTHRPSFISLAAG